MTLFSEVPSVLYPVLPISEAKESLKLNAHKVQVMFEVENLDYHVPRLCIQSSLNGKVEDWSKQLRCEAELHLEMSVFNEKKALWEPLLEPVMAAEDNYRPWEVFLKVYMSIEIDKLI
jgi:hypothetical protein